MRRIIVYAIGFVLGFSIAQLMATPASATEESYKLGPGDVIEVSVWRDENLTKELIIPPDGIMSFPLVEDVRVTDMTVPQLRQTIQKKLAEFVPDATVTVMLLSANSLRAYVIGKVNNPGVFPITMETDVMKVLAMAGGLNPFASPNKILILRRQNGQDVKLPFNYNEVKNGENLEQNVLLRRGDIVVVP
jgi:polysaccharide export outer membrane protein